jgi:hypothetical protein
MFAVKSQAKYIKIKIKIILQTFEDFRRLSKTFEDFRRLSKTFEDLRRPAMAPIRGPELAKLFRGHVSLEIGDHGEVRPWRLRPAPRRNMEKPWRTTS